MSSQWNLNGRSDHEQESGRFWEGDGFGASTWDFNALNEDHQDWDVWDDLEGADQLWDDAHGYNFEPYAGLSHEFPPQSTSARGRPASPDYLRPSPRHMNNTSSSNNALSNNFIQALRAPNQPQARSNNHTLPASYDSEHHNNNHRHRTTVNEYLQNDNFNFEPYDAHINTQPTPPSDSFSDGIDIDDILASDEDEDAPDTMAPSTRRRSAQNNNTVDLTADDSSPPSSQIRMTAQPRSLKRTAAEASSSSQSRPKKLKTRRLSTPSTLTHTPKAEAEIDTLDLTNEAPSAEEELLQAQQAATIAAQQEAARTDSLTQKIGRRNCIICMEPLTNATITHCGHIYCHECLTQALLAGEKSSERGVGNCPVCRKPVRRTNRGAAGSQMVLVNLMTRKRYKGIGREKGGSVKQADGRWQRPDG